MTYDQAKNRYYAVKIYAPDSPALPRLKADLEAAEAAREAERRDWEATRSMVADMERDGLL